MPSFTSIPVWSVLVVASCGGAGQALGDPLTFYFSGNINVVHEYLDLDDSVYNGAPFHGYYSFDPTSVSDFYPNDPQVGSYRFGSAGRMWAQIGNYEFVTQELGILIWNDLLSIDIYQPISTTDFIAAGYQWSSMKVQLVDNSGAALDSDALPTGVPELSAFSSKNFGIFLPGDDLGIGGRLTSLTPEPGSLAILGLAVATMLARRTRR